MKKLIAFLIYGIILFPFLNVEPAIAHLPHDDIEQVSISQNYYQDQTVFVIVRENLLRSNDGGKSWKKLVQGLNNNYPLYWLGTSPDSDKILYLSTLGSGIYKSEDQGNSWTKVNNGLDNLNIDLISVVSKDTVIAAGTEGGLYLTSDGGRNWNKIMNNKHKITAIQSINNGEKYVILGDNQGNFYLSSDNGKSWNELGGLKIKKSITTIAFSPKFTSDSTFFVGINGGGIYKSINRGKTFYEVNHGLPDRKITSLLISSNDYSHEYTLFSVSEEKGLYYSKDQGKNWINSTQGLTTDPQAKSLKRPNFSHAVLSPTYNQDKTVFLAGFDGLFKSTDGGHKWRQKETISSNIIVGLDISPKYNQNSTVAITTYLGGAFLFNSTEMNWKSLNNERLYNKKVRAKNPNHVRRLFDIAFSPNYYQDNSLFTSTWGKFFRSEDSGKSWILLTPYYNLENRSKNTGIYLLTISPNFANDHTIYLASRNGEIIKSTDRGKSFKLIGDIRQQIDSFVISPNFSSDKSLYAATQVGIYKSLDGGKVWKLVSKDLPCIPRTVISDRTPTACFMLAISPNYRFDNNLLAATPKGAFMSIDGGKNWKKLIIKGYDDNTSVEAVAISPNYQQDETFTIHLKGIGLFKTTDRGSNFKAIGKDLIKSNISLANMEAFNSTATPIKFSPTYAEDKTIYGFFYTSLFKSVDAGETWVKYTLPEKTGQANLLSFLSSRLTNVHINRKAIGISIIMLLVTLIVYFTLKYLVFKINI